MSAKLFEPGCGAQIFFTAGAFCMFVGWKSASGGGLTTGWGQFFMGCLVAIPFLVIGSLLAKRDEETDQVWANDVAEHALKNALEASQRGGNQSITLYLRPFSLTNQLRFSQPQLISAPDPAAFHQRADIDLETVIAKHFADSAPLVGLGEPGEHVGAGRVLKSEEEWREAVKLLAIGAKTVLVVPSAQPGTRWEICWLKKKSLFHRCVFLMPPQPDLSEIDLTSAWREACSALSALDLEIPPYDSSGMLFLLEQSGQLARSQPLRKSGDSPISPSSFRSALTALSPATLAPKRATRPADDGIAGNRALKGSSPPQRTKLPAISYSLIALLLAMSAVIQMCHEVDSPDNRNQRAEGQGDSPEGALGSISGDLGNAQSVRSDERLSADLPEAVLSLEEGEAPPNRTPDSEIARGTRALAAGWREFKGPLGGHISAPEYLDLEVRPDGLALTDWSIPLMCSITVAENLELLARQLNSELMLRTGPACA